MQTAFERIVKVKPIPPIFEPDAGAGTPTTAIHSTAPRMEATVAQIGPARINAIHPPNAKGSRTD
jgi:hypothetical protein